ncbi:MAG: ABC transporter ATP-binding protein [bacterium]|nr:ABC transporter ATP-binding protein [bacterium]
MENRYSIEIKNLKKSYDNGQSFAVNDISFNVEKGSLFAFLGMNGAGKSTTINIICSILEKDDGKIYINGQDLDNHLEKIKKEIGVVYQNSVLDEFLTVKENLKIRSNFYGLTKEEKNKNFKEIVELLDLNTLLNKSIKDLSGGQKRRIDIARAMIHKPKLLILDEPTTGLDPKARIIVWDLIEKIRKETNMTVLLTTHYLEEAEKASMVVIMNKGKIIASGSPNELKNKFAKDYIYTYVDFNEEFSKNLAELNYFCQYFEDKHAYKIEISDFEDAQKLFKDYPEMFVDVEIIKGTMNDVFLNVISERNN